MTKTVLSDYPFRYISHFTSTVGIEEMMMLLLMLMMLMMLMKKMMLLMTRGARKRVSVVVGVDPSNGWGSTPVTVKG